MRGTFHSKSFQVVPREFWASHPAALLEVQEQKLLGKATGWE